MTSRQSVSVKFAAVAVLAMLFVVSVGVGRSIAAERTPSLYLCSSILRSENAERASERILNASDRRDGLCVIVNASGPELAVALAKRSKFVVQTLHDTAELDAIRKSVDQCGLYGRVSARKASFERLPYTDNLINLLIACDYHLLQRHGLTVDEMLRVVAPHGEIWLQCSSASDAETAQRHLLKGGLAPTEINGEGGRWVRAAKPYPREMDQWSHFRHDATGNMVARDTLVGPPRRVQWVSGPIWQRHHALTPGTSSMITACGRLFYIQDESPIGFAGLPDQWALLARDAFNGKLLWKRPIEKWGDRAWSWWVGGHGARGNHPVHIRKRLVASDDRVFVTLGHNASVSALDPATGKTLMEYEGTRYADEMVYHDGVLYVSVNDRPQAALPGRGFFPRPTAENTSEKTIWAIEPVSGKVFWKAGPYVGITDRGDRMRSMKNVQLVASEAGIFLADQDVVVGLDLKTGQERFRSPVRASGKVSTMYHGGMLMVASRGTLTAIDARTGENRWQNKSGSLGGTDVPGVFGIGGLVWVGDRISMEMTAYDCTTGEVKQRVSIAKVLADAGHHHRCYPNKSTVKYLISGRRAAEFTNYETGEVTLNHWARGQCRLGLMPANGLLYKPPDPCGCYLKAKLLGFYALAPRRTASELSETTVSEGNPLQKGKAFGAVAEEEIASASEWPVFRHDSLRSNSVETEIPDDLKTLWSVDLGGKLSPPVIAGGRVYVSAVDAHKIYALDEKSGKELWTYFAGGRVDSPPSVHRGMLIFGSADGWVYCLRASDGALAWRFRAAPNERQIMARSQVESAWPVHGSVLAGNGVVYCTAGRSSFVDGGIYLYALDAATGEVLDKKVIHEVQTVDNRSANQMPESFPGAGSDILVTDGKEVYMRDRRLDLSVPFKAGANDYIFEADSHLNTKTNFFDQFWFHRHNWEYGKVRGNMIAFDREAAYAVFPYSGQGGSNYRLYVPQGGDAAMIPDKNKLSEEETGLKHMAGVFTGGFELWKSGGKETWTLDKFPIGPFSMVIAGKKLLLAGFVDAIDPTDPWANIEGRKGSALWLLSKKNGRTLSQYSLETLPVWNGMAAANRKVFISFRNGRLACMGR